MIVRDLCPQVKVDRQVKYQKGDVGEVPLRIHPQTVASRVTGLPMKDIATTLLHPKDNLMLQVTLL